MVEGGCHGEWDSEARAQSTEDQDVREVRGEAKWGRGGREKEPRETGKAAGEPIPEQVSPMCWQPQTSAGEKSGREWRTSWSPMRERVAQVGVVREGYGQGRAQTEGQQLPMGGGDKQTAGEKKAGSRRGSRGVGW